MTGYTVAEFRVQRFRQDDLDALQAPLDACEAAEAPSGAKIAIKVLIYDRDSKFSSDFDTVFSAAGIRIARTPLRSPRANAACERVLGALRPECLDRLIILGEHHLLQVLRAGSCASN